MTTWRYIEGELGKSGWTNGLPVAFQGPGPACACWLHGSTCTRGHDVSSWRPSPVWALGSSGGILSFFPRRVVLCVCLLFLHKLCLLKSGRGELKCSMMPGINSALDFYKKVVNDQLKWSLRIFCFFCLVISLKTVWYRGKSRFRVRLNQILIQNTTTFQLRDFRKLLSLTHISSSSWNKDTTYPEGPSGRFAVL